MKDCNQCGKCCVIYADGGLSASQKEIDAWEENRPDIFAYVSDGKIWVDPATGQQLRYCPWLTKVSGQQKYTCRIYNDRPDDCRFYPSNIDEMVRDECEMLEPRYLANPTKAQRTLDELMAESREF
jgi:Fe-S-cluster containining protein